MIFAVMTALIICIFLIFLIRKNVKNLKLKEEYGEIIQANVISWKVVWGRPNRYVIKVEYEKDKKQEIKILISSGKFAKKYEYIRNIQIVTVPNSDKVFLEEEDWRSQNVCYFVLLIAVAIFLLQLLLINLVSTFM